MIAPFLEDEEAKVRNSKAQIQAEVQASTQSAGKKSRRPKSLSHALLELRLPMREESIRALRAILRVFVRVSSARPRDGENAVVVDAKPIYLDFANHPLFKQFSGSGPNPAFVSEQFRRVCASVKQAEDSELTHSRVPDTTEGHVGALKHAVGPEFDRLHIRMASLEAGNKECRSMLEQLLARGPGGGGAGSGGGGFCGTSGATSEPVAEKRQMVERKKGESRQVIKASALSSPFTFT